MADDVPDGELARRITDAGPDARAAETAVCARFSGRIRLYGLRHLGDPASAADLVQQVLERVLSALREGRVENPDNLAGFVLGTCRYVSWDLRRAEQRQRAIEAAASVLSDPTPPPDSAASQADVLRLFGCLQRLPERDGIVVRMSFMEDRSTDEIGQRLGLTVGNVRVVRHRALARLHECLENGGGP